MLRYPGPPSRTPARRRRVATEAHVVSPGWTRPGRDYEPAERVVTSDPKSDQSTQVLALTAWHAMPSSGIRQSGECHSIGAVRQRDDAGRNP
jgi:hypothetical protein